MEKYDSVNDLINAYCEKKISLEDAYFRSCEISIEELKKYRENYKLNSAEKAAVKNKIKFFTALKKLTLSH